jgi:phage tail-like protein
MKRRTLLSVLVVGALAAVAVAGAAFATSNRSMPAVPPEDSSVVSFGLTAGGQDIGLFRDLVTMSSGADPATLVNTAGDRNVKTLLPAKRPPDFVVLSHGLTSSTEIQAWHDLVLDGNVAGARKDAVLTLYDSAHQPVARYHLENAWPSKVELGELESGTTQVVMETVTIVCERIQRVSV